MRLIEVYVEVQRQFANDNTLRLGSLLFECGLKISGIHFSISNGCLYVNYPAVRDKKQRFHSSFEFFNAVEDRVAKVILRSAFDKTIQNGGHSIYGYLVSSCDKELNILTIDDFEWAETPSTDSPSFTGIQQFPIEVNILRQYPDYAYVRASFGSSFFLSNIKVIRTSEGNISVQFPYMSYPPDNCPFILDEDKQYAVDCITDQVKFYASAKTPQTRAIEQEDGSANQENLRFALWNASTNGYILQSRIPDILRKHHIDWKSSFHVSSVTSLVEKMDFLSSRNLEVSPGHFVKWVSVSHKEDSSLTKIAKLATPLNGELKEALRSVLTLECQEAGGRLDLSAIIPLFSKKYPNLLAQFPNLKLKAILQDCDFVKFEGGPVPPIFVRILEDNSAVNDETPSNPLFYMNHEKSSDTSYADRLPVFADLQRETQEHISSSEHTKLDDSDGHFQKKKTVLIAKSNPFTLYPHTRMIAENTLPDTKVPTVGAKDAMKGYSLRSLHGHMDSMDLDIVYWISNMQYSKTSFLMDLISGGYIDILPGRIVDQNRLSIRLMRLYKVGFIKFYRLCSMSDQEGIISKSNFRIMMITSFAHTQLRAIGRRSDYTNFMELENTETILRRLSINQWFAKFALYFPNFSKYYFSTVVTAQIATANAARFNLIVDYCGIPALVTSIRRGLLHNMDIRSGDFAFWIQRVANIIKNYNSLYIEAQVFSFVKKPLVIFICEDDEHCVQVYNEIQSITTAICDADLLDSVCFANDIDVFNHFLDAHYQFDREATRTPISIVNYFEAGDDVLSRHGSEAEIMNSSDSDDDYMDELSNFVVDGE